ncbi:GGDEF domain-containing protein [Thermanaerovibrio velox DSM 12556]|uniref:GGDEF domain-containing protein n=1 Tax=Thermanaerovibrio velox DSM 12556 TaxID=926567 RepID=H0UQQ2_9BACT|nr:diguanylate cyclase [Thermanaerovibrio velox]EHM10816.1 GGDEF domain-containing protein [Thermanaerovibrio velox DSM 12556]
MNDRVDLNGLSFLRLTSPASPETLPLGDVAGVLVEPFQGAEEAIRRIRGRLDGVLIPVFLTAPLDNLTQHLCDGVGRSEEDLVRFTQDARMRIDDVSPSMLAESLDYRLLAFLYTRPQRDLEPVLIPLTSQVYHWPLMEAIGNGLLEPRGWISNLSDRGFIREATPSGLVERVRYCPRCDGGHINCVDLCPFCSSMDFEQVPFIHCFVCGRVGPEEDFLKSGEMRCPFCGSRLRHIGADYDRPMESYRCRDCGKSFPEPQVSCHCLLCGLMTEPEALVPRNFYRYRITDKGILAVQTGEMEDRYAVLDTLNYMKPEPFMHILNWMVGLSKRPPVEPFCLMLIRFPNLEAFLDSMGRTAGSQAFRELIGRIREMVRATDVSTRTEAGEVLLLLPKTPRSGGSVLKGRLEALAGKVESRGVPLRMEIKMLSVPEDLQRDDDGDLFAARLRGD